MLRTIAKFRNPDVTSDLNNRMRNLITKGIFSGGQVVPVAGSLQVDVFPFAAMGSDGMVTILEGAAERVSVLSGVSQWILLYSRYIANAPPSPEIEVLTEADYTALSDEEKNYRVKIAHVEVSPGASEVEATKILFTESDFIDPVRRSSFRGSVQSKTNLPDYTPTPTGFTTVNRAHDIYFVQDDRLFYSWDVSGTPAWKPIISASEEVALAGHKLNQDDGTLPPNFYESQHITVIQRESLDDGPASVKAMAGSGTPYGTGNALMDEQYPISVKTGQQMLGLGGATEFQLSGKVFIGKGVQGTAESLIQLGKFAGPVMQSLVGTDGRRISVWRIYDSTNTFWLDPSAHSDALGFYEDPWVKIDFSETSDVGLPATFAAFWGTEAKLGEITPLNNGVLSRTSFVEPASYVPVDESSWSLVTGSTVQEALDSVDTEIASIPGDLAALRADAVIGDQHVVTVGPSGSDAHFTGDDHAPFALACLALASDGGTVLVLPGEYRFASQVSIPDNVQIVGVAPVRSQSTGSNGARFRAETGHTGYLFFTNETSAGLKNLTFNLLCDDASTNAVIRCEDGYDSGITVEDCLFLKWGSGTNLRPCGISYERVSTNQGHFRVRNCTFAMIAPSSRGLIEYKAATAFTIEGNYFTFMPIVGEIQAGYCIYSYDPGTPDQYQCSYKIINNTMIASELTGGFLYGWVSGYHVTTGFDDERGRSHLLIAGNQLKTRLDAGGTLYLIRVESAQASTDGVETTIANNHLESYCPTFFFGTHVTPKIHDNFIRSLTYWIRSSQQEDTSIHNNKIYSGWDNTSGTLLPTAGGTRQYFSNNFWHITSDAATTIYLEDTECSNNVFKKSTTTGAVNYDFCIVLQDNTTFVNNVLDLTDPELIWYQNGAIWLNGNRIVVRDCQILGHSSLPEDTIAVYQGSDYSDITVENCLITGFYCVVKQVMVTPANSTNFKFNNNTFSDIVVWGQIESYNSQFTNNRMVSQYRAAFNSSNWGAILVVERANNSIIADNHLGFDISTSPTTADASNTNRRGIWLHQSQYVTVRNNYVTDVGFINSGIYLIGETSEVNWTKECVIDGNTIRHVSQTWTNDPDFSYAIRCGSNGHYQTIVNNSIAECYSDTSSKSHYGIYGINSSGCICSNNRIWGNSSSIATVNTGIAGFHIADGNHIIACTLGMDSCDNCCSNRLYNCYKGMDSAYRCSSNYIDSYTALLQPGGSDQYMGISCTYGQLQGNRIVQSGSVGNVTTNGNVYVIDTSAYSEISGNHIEVLTATCGILTNHTCTITGNSILNLGSKRAAGLTAPMYGINVNGATVGSVSITGNTINKLQSTDVGAIGIIITSGERCSIVGNNIGGAAWGGNWAANSAYNITGSEHVVVGNNLGGRGFTDTSSGSIVANNNP